MSRPRILALTAAGAVAALALPGAAIAGHYRSVPAPPTNPTSASQIQNIDQVKTAIKGYYGDQVPTPSTADPVPNDVDGGDHPLHQYTPGGAYDGEVSGITAGAGKYLASEAKAGQKHTGARAILFDVDDTTLNTYSYEIYSNFVYNPATNEDFVDAGSKDVFPAVPSMPQLVAKARSLGYTVFFLTGRPESQREGTRDNLADTGYGDVDASHLYLKDDAGQPWITCDTEGDAKCTTIERKSETRAHIESLGYDIVANFGDQYSDLTGGFADKTYKIPNPMYYLP